MKENKREIKRICVDASLLSTTFVASILLETAPASGRNDVIGREAIGSDRCIGIICYCITSGKDNWVNGVHVTT